MTKKSNYSIFQYALIAIVIFAAAAGGIYFGLSMQQPPTDNTSNYESQAFKTLQLQAGNAFPDVKLLDKNIDLVSSLSLLHEDKTLVLFMDAECPPCHDISLYWQKLLNENKVSQNQIVAISFNDYGYLEEFIEQNKITYALYTDPEIVFFNKYGIDAYPFALVVNSDGSIESVITDSDKMKDLSIIK